MSTTFYIRYDDTQHDEQQPEGSKKQTKAAQRADLLHNNRSAANSLAQTIGAASSSTQEAQVESTVSPAPCMSDGANQKAPQASQLRLARRRPEFFGQAHERRDLVQLPCSPRSDVAHAALNSAAAQAPVAHELVKELAFHKLLASDFLLAFFFGEEGKGAGGARKEAARQERDTARVLPRGPRGPRREAPAVPQRGTLRNFWPSCSAGGGSWGL